MISNTSKSPNPEWLSGGNPKAIEQQEAQGQIELTHSSQLPIKRNHPINGPDVKELYTAMGIEVLSLSKGDENMFYDVRLPDGWRIEPTDHPMWSKLLDRNDSERGSIFYKAAFYDRSAHINLNPRYRVEHINQGNDWPYPGYWAIVDLKSKGKIYSGRNFISNQIEIYDAEYNRASERLNKHFPLINAEYLNNPIVYWEDK